MNAEDYIRTEPGGAAGVVLALATPGLTVAQIVSCLALAGVPTGLPVLAYARDILAQEVED